MGVVLEDLQVPLHVTRAWCYAAAARRGRRWAPEACHVGRQEAKDHVTSLASSTMNREEPNDWKALEVEAFSTVKRSALSEDRRFHARNLLEHGLPLMLRTEEDFTELGSSEKRT